MACIETSVPAASKDVASDWASKLAATSAVLFCVPKARSDLPNCPAHRFTQSNRALPHTL
eukprot:6535080-Pyramimonas_sp.AAC.1